MKKYVAHVTCLALVGLLIGCSQEASTPSTSGRANSASAPGVDGSKYLLTTEPEGATDVIKARQEVKDQDDVVVVGRIGGSENPWIEGMAAFTIVDPLLKHCHELGDDGCPKPWDFC